MPSWLIPALVVLGLMLLYLEFFVPGGILAAASGILLVSATILVFVHHGAAWGSITALILLALVALLLRFWMIRFHRSYLGKRLTIRQAVGHHEYLASLPSLMGQTGLTLTELRPSGKALINGEKYDVVSSIATVPSGTPVKVHSIDGIRITVIPVERVASPACNLP